MLGEASPAGTSGPLFDYPDSLSYYAAVPLALCAVGIIHMCVGVP